MTNGYLLKDDTRSFYIDRSDAMDVIPISSHFFLSSSQWTSNRARKHKAQAQPTIQRSSTRTPTPPHNIQPHRPRTPSKSTFENHASRLVTQTHTLYCSISVSLENIANSSDTHSFIGNWWWRLPSSSSLRAFALVMCAQRADGRLLYNSINTQTQTTTSSIDAGELLRMDLFAPRIYSPDDKCLWRGIYIYEYIYYVTISTGV